MIWLFHRRGEYLACEVRTCLQNSGFELVVTGSGRDLLEWYAEANDVERRWYQLKDLLEREGWGDVYERPGPSRERRGFRLHIVPTVTPMRSTVRD